VRSEDTRAENALPRVGARLVELEIDHRAVAAPEGSTVLRAAELAGIYVPSLCFHKELSPFGGCRLCTVEIAGMRGYPLACSTLVQDGMQVTTETLMLREMRQEILQLILSQHPSSCLLCGEKDDCERSLKTIHKAGVSTGCHSCPSDGACELQEVVERVGVAEINYPVTYRGLEVEHDDPFYDRDYNLCILCGRCVRMCHEVRGTSVLSFKYRGPRTLIGPAFGRSHVEAGCEFCGACVSVCPTGALADKVSKWDGAVEKTVISTCPFCGVGCQLELAVAEGRLSQAAGARDEEINDGQLCVRGRFCLPEATHHHSRARKPMLRRGAYFRVASWDEALDEVGEKLTSVAPEDVLMLLSADLTNEGLFAAQRFARDGLGAGGVDSTAGADLPGGAALWSRLYSLPISMKALAEAEAIIVGGLDSRFSFSVVGVQVRRALRRGAVLVTVDARESNMARMAHQWLRPPVGQEAAVVSSLLRSVADGEAAPGVRGAQARVLATAADRLRGTSRLGVVIGPRVFDCAGAAALVTELEKIGAARPLTVLPLLPGANLRGALELGAFAGLLPGPRQAGEPVWGLSELRRGRRAKVLYLIGEAPFATRPDCDYLIVQDLYEPVFEVDAFLPAASFAEASGTLTNLEGRVQPLRGVENLPEDAVHGFARPDWRIFSDLAQRLGRDDLHYADAAAVRAAIRAEVPGYPAEDDRAPRRMVPLPGASAPTSETPAGAGRFVLVQERAGFRHRGVDLARIVEGLGELHLEEGLRLSPADMDHLGVRPGGAVTVSVNKTQLVLAAMPDADCPRGAAFVTRPQTGGALAGLGALLEPLRTLSPTPMRVRISAGDRSKHSPSVARAATRRR
jgi:predicted molibdopterin-dependent oxidoreductase YjgC